MHAYVCYDLDSKKKKWAHITSLWICILLVFCCYCLFWFWVLGSCNWGWPWTLRKTKDDLEFPILLLLPPEWILRLRVYSQPARCDFFLLLLFACFIGTGDIQLSYPHLQSPKGLWNKTSDCLQVVCLWEGGLHFVLCSSSFFWGKLTFNSSLSRGDWNCHWSLFRKISFPWILKEVWKKQRKYLN